MITVSYQNAAGETVRSVSHEREAFLCVDTEYAPGDRLVFTAFPGAHLMVQPDAAILPGEVYLPEGSFAWRVPVGDERRPYSPGVFVPGRHTVSARVMTQAELFSRRNLACNPADQRGDTAAYPHCTANVETRGEADFAARNVIDGWRFNDHHGKWPYQSWGIGAREDAWCLLEFGREVEIDEMALTLRADFPHDAWWTHGQALLSSGDTVDFSLEKTAERQFVSLGVRRVSWIRLQNLHKSDDPSAFPSLIEWEVFGRDVP